MENRKYPLYMFDMDFDAISLPPEPVDVADDAPPPPTFSADELTAARDEGLAAGRAEGIEQSNTGFENQIAETLTAMTRTLATLAQTQTQTNEDTARTAVKLAVAAAAKLMPEYARQHGLAEIESFVTRCLGSLFEGAAVTVRVPEAQAAEIGERIEAIAERAGFGDGLKLVADPELGPADCRVDWNDGGTARNAATLMAEIDDIVEKFLEQPPEPTPPNDPPPPVEETAVAVEPNEVAETAPQIADAPAEPEEAAEPAPPIADATMEPEESVESAPPLADAAAEDSEIIEQPPEIEPPATESASTDDNNESASNTAIEMAGPEEPRAPAPEPAAGPVLPGAVDIDPAAT